MKAGIYFLAELAESKGKSVGYKGKKSNGPGPFYRQSQSPLMLGAGSGNAPWEYLPPLGNKPAQCICILIINFQFLYAELADFLLEKNFAFTAPAIFSVPAVHLRIHTPVPIPVRTGSALVIINIFFVRHINS